MRAKPMVLGGWGRAPLAAVSAFRPERLGELRQALIKTVETGTVARGGGRSYGDQALNAGGHVMLTERLDRVLAFDRATGVLVAEPGLTFNHVLHLFLKHGLQAPVSPRTRFPTPGGAGAHDVHGQNH